MDFFFAFFTSGSIRSRGDSVDDSASGTSSFLFLFELFAVEILLAGAEVKVDVDASLVPDCLAGPAIDGDIEEVDTSIAFLIGRLLDMDSVPSDVFFLFFFCGPPNSGAPLWLSDDFANEILSSTSRAGRVEARLSLAGSDALREKSSVVGRVFIVAFFFRSFRWVAV